MSIRRGRPTPNVPTRHQNVLQTLHPRVSKLHIKNEKGYGVLHRIPRFLSREGHETASIYKPSDRDLDMFRNIERMGHDIVRVNEREERLHNRWRQENMMKLNSVCV